MTLTIAEWLAAFGQPLLEHTRLLIVFASHAVNQAQLKLDCVRSRPSSCNDPDDLQTHNDNRQKNQEAA